MRRSVEPDLRQKLNVFSKSFFVGGFALGATSQEPLKFSGKITCDDTMGSSNTFSSANAPCVCVVCCFGASNIESMSNSFAQAFDVSVNVLPQSRRAWCKVTAE